MAIIEIVSTINIGILAVCQPLSRENRHDKVLFNNIPTLTIAVLENDVEGKEMPCGRAGSLLYPTFSRMPTEARDFAKHLYFAVT